ncbi:hypothetical protein HS041_12295 [Planomonospora sp. ID67723]|uniref:hypothetical protein n=1 Tax=Planomonospora sp. ID67723 TaxID=2738134 RepID=UPI0018C3CD37|nr:hypothetical protein [Planomonospora sp. ID67723]MBG0828549.1 hypothetical protein [Planomonospora sp. ID67723]
MRYQVTAPEEGFSGEIGGVTFAKGVATADSTAHRAALAYFRRRGFPVTPVQPPAPAVEPEKKPSRRGGANAKEDQ